MNDEHIIELYFRNNDSAISATSDKYGSNCYNIAHNILMSNGAATECVNNTWQAIKGAIPPTRPKNLKLYIERIARQLAFNQYITHSASMINTGSMQNNEMALILDELAECTSLSTDDNENVISLQLSNIIDSFARSLPRQHCEFFLRRYFYAESVSTIAANYNIREDNIQNILTHLRQQLREIMSNHKYSFKATTLFASFTDISDDLLDNPVEMTTISKKSVLKPLSIVAGLFIVICIGIIIPIFISSSTPNNNEENSTTSLKEFSETEFIYDGYVSIEKLVNYTPQFITDEAKMTQIDYQGYIFSYTQQILENSDVLRYLTGRTVDCYSTSAFAEWFTLKGHNEFRYLICKQDNEYTLWKFDYIICDITNTESFYFPMYLIYDILSSDDIAEIIVTPVYETTDMDADDVVDSSIVVTDYGDINYIYYVMSNMICYGCHNWDLICDYPTYDFAQIDADAVNLTIVTIDGETIDNFYYSKLAGCFYESTYGIAYSKVSDNAKNRLMEIFYPYDVSITQ